MTSNYSIMLKMNKSYPMLLLLLCLSTLLFSQTFPAKQWAYSTKTERSQWDARKLQDYRKYIQDSSVVTGLLIIHKGKIVFEYGDTKENSYIASCRKSVLSMLYGKYVQEGSIDLDKTIEQLNITDVQGLLPIEKKARIRDLISARSGVYHPEGYAGGMQKYAPKRGSIKPGTYWLYNNWDFNVAGYILEKETGKNIYDEVEQQLAIPLQMQDWDRSLQHKEGDSTISKYPGYPMWFSTRDMARLGLLMLNKGNWKGKQILSEQWVNEMTQAHTSYKEVNEHVPNFRKLNFGFGYGYMWWLFQNIKDTRLEGAFAAVGAMGQAIAIYPKMNTLVVYKTKSDYMRFNSRMTKINLLTRVATCYKQ